jgi:hypothetical protein
MVRVKDENAEGLRPRKERRGAEKTGFADAEKKRDAETQRRREKSGSARTEEPVACVAQAWEDVALRVQLSVEGGTVDLNVGV